MRILYFPDDMVSYLISTMTSFGYFHCFMISLFVFAVHTSYVLFNCGASSADVRTFITLHNMGEPTRPDIGKDAPVISAIETQQRRGWRSTGLSHGWQATEPSYVHNLVVANPDNRLLFGQEPDQPFTDNASNSTY